jgi:hypothetical protein
MQREGEIAFGRMQGPAGVGRGLGGNQDAVLEYVLRPRALGARGGFPGSGLVGGILGTEAPSLDGIDRSGVDGDGAIPARWLGVG